MKKLILSGLVTYIILIASCNEPGLEKDLLEGYVLDSLIVTPLTVQLSVGATQQLNVKGKYIKIETTVVTNEGVLGEVSDTTVEITDTQISDMAPGEVNWHSDDLFICTVSVYGILEGKNPGSTGVWCEKEGLKSNIISVSVVP